MKIEIDTEGRTLTADGVASPLYAKAAFEALSDLWLKVGWNLKYTYSFSWLGVPIIQLPEDMIRIQEVIFRVQPDVIVETGVAHGGSLIYYASLCKMLGHGRVIGVEKDFRHGNVLRDHPLGGYVTLINGDSCAPETVANVSALCAGARVLVILDSDHSKAHVAAELEAYCALVGPGSYMIACDGNMKDLHDAPRGSPAWKWDNPHEAASEFACRNPEFVIEQPERPFNESSLTNDVTYWPSAYLRRVS